MPVVLQFLVDHVARGEAGTRVHDLRPAIKAHTLREAPNPVRDVGVQELPRRIRRAHAQRGELPTPKQALTNDPLEAMLATCTDGLIGVRDRALLLFAWASGVRRRSEVTGAVMDQLVTTDASPRGQFFDAFVDPWLFLRPTGD